MMKKLTALLPLVLLLSAVAWLATGCHLGKPASASFASVVIHGKTPAEIHAATSAVFKANEYLEQPAPEGWTFEREATQGETLSYGGLYSARYSVATLVRVRVRLVELGEDAQRLQCQAYMITDAKDPLMSREIQIGNFRSEPYQELLEEVAKRLGQP